MTETTLLTDHQAIQDWAGARAGVPVIRDAAELIGITEPVLMIEFGQQAYEDNDANGSDRPDALGSPRLVDWDEWFELFDEKQLALVVATEVAGQRDEFHELVRR
ncbi:hypothetical protein [Phyllobacterium sp. YR531]|uniref:hypothetical protein n=1 Tax=Phyllobacterium sp. YR531 TaxID=1144343 RepID=UPI00026F7E9C|nr:hypothetical protein [Phyllobacterium sp. YR531]EJN01680.1 hypothetical protein PMI41_03396 [Phyllobacterium sp. YR531]